MRKLFICAACVLIIVSAFAYMPFFDKHNLVVILDKGEVDLALFNKTFDWSRQRGSYADWFTDLHVALAKATSNEPTEEMYFYLSHQLTTEHYVKNKPSFKRLVRSTVADYQTATEIGCDQDKLALKTFLGYFGWCLHLNVKQYHDVIRVDIPGQMHLPGGDWMPEKTQPEQPKTTAAQKAKE